MPETAVVVAPVVVVIVVAVFSVFLFPQSCV